MKRIIATLVLSVCASFSLSGLASADSGVYCGSSANGCDASASHTTCSGAGAFGAFGSRDNNFAGGANGTQTGINNSTLCGSPQGH